jgi:flagellin
METSMARLSTGKRINSASDDAAGVAISSRLSAEIRGTDQAIRNSLDGQALIDTAEGAHKEIENILQRMREVSVQAANDTNNTQDRGNLQAEMDALIDEVDRIADTTTWAGTNLMEQGASDFTFQVGTATGEPNRITVTIDGMTSGELGLGGSTGIIQDDFKISQHTAADNNKYDALTLTAVVESPANDATNKFDLSFAVQTDGSTLADPITLTLFGKTVELDGDAQTDSAHIRTAFAGFGVSVDITDNYNTGQNASDLTNTDDVAATDGVHGQGNAYLQLTVPQSGASSNLSVGSGGDARTSIGAIDTAIFTVNNQRSALGAVSNRLNHTVNNLTNISTNLSAAIGVIEDADFALETTNLSKHQILQQASTAMLAQANASKQNVLSLLQG